MEEEEGKGVSKSIRVIPGTMSESLKGGYVGDREVIVHLFIELITFFPTVISSTSMTNLIIITSDFDGSTARTQGFIDCGIVGREAIVVKGGVFDWFLGFFSKGGRHSSDGDQRGGSLEGVMGLGCAQLFPEEDEVEERAEEEVDDLFDVVAGQW